VSAAARWSSSGATLCTAEASSSPLPLRATGATPVIVGPAPGQVRTARSDRSNVFAVDH